MGKAKKLRSSFEDEEEYEKRPRTCEYCGRRIEDPNDTGSLCFNCYTREYYPEHSDDPDWR